MNLKNVETMVSVTPEVAGHTLDNIDDYLHLAIIMHIDDESTIVYIDDSWTIFIVCIDDILTTIYIDNTLTVPNMLYKNGHKGFSGLGDVVLARC